MKGYRVMIMVLYDHHAQMLHYEIFLLRFKYSFQPPSLSVEKLGPVNFPWFGELFFSSLANYLSTSLSLIN